MPGGRLQLQGLTRRYGRVLALDQLDLEIPAGSFVTLLGPSGCGKSTTLNLIAGLDRADGGQILLGDRDITHVPPNERRMAMVFQNYALYPHMTAEENISFGLRLQGRPKSEIRSRVDTVADALAIKHLLKRRPSQLSGGQQQRIALARALVKEPEVFLLDEPFSNLDAALRSRMRTEVKHLHLALGTTSVFVTHDQEEAMTLSDWIAVMHDGRLVQFGTQRDVYKRPANVYVGTFVGKPRMSLLTGELRADGTGGVFESPEATIRLPSPSALGIEAMPSGKVHLGMRAEDLTVVPDPDDSMPQATVGLLEPIGSDTFVELGVGPTATIVARVSPDATYQIGQRVGWSVSPDRLHVFDVDSGNRLNA